MNPNKENKKFDLLPAIAGNNIEEVVEKFRQHLLDREKSLPKNMPRTLSTYMIYIEWDYLN